MVGETGLFPHILWYLDVLPLALFTVAGGKNRKPTNGIRRIQLKHVRNTRGGPGLVAQMMGTRAQYTSN